MLGFGGTAGFILPEIINNNKIENISIILQLSLLVKLCQKLKIKCKLQKKYSTQPLNLITHHDDIEVKSCYKSSFTDPQTFNYLRL